MGKSKLGGRCWRQGGLRLWRVPPSDAVAAEGHLEKDIAAEGHLEKDIAAEGRLEKDIAAQIDEVQVVASLAADGMEEECCLWSK
jgi:hypothetical protein